MYPYMFARSACRIAAVPSTLAKPITVVTNSASPMASFVAERPHACLSCWTIACSTQQMWPGITPAAVASPCAQQALPIGWQSASPRAKRCFLMRA